MPRSLRNDYEGAWHHVMSRGAGRATIFARDAERELYLDSLAEAGSRYGVEIHCYCLMGNHYHLLVRSLDGQLSAAMRYCSGRFTALMNKREGRDGPLFRGRFASAGIRGDPYLVGVSRYIHLNPVEAGLVGAPEEWRWSSAAAYVGTAQTPHWLRTDFILGMFAAPARAAYREFLNSPENGEGVEYRP
jgi:putative transposase